MGKENYPRRCNRGCGNMIWMQKCFDGYWRAFDFPNNTFSRKWEKHDCRGVE
jgi:hypothetical protein